MEESKRSPRTDGGVEGETASDDPVEGLVDWSDSDTSTSAEPVDIEEHPERAAIVEEVRDYFETADVDTSFAQPPDEEFTAERFFDFSYLAEYEVLDRKWVDRPYAYVSLLQPRGGGKTRYHVHEPALTPFETYVRDDLVKVLRNELIYESLEDESDREAVFRRRAKDTIADHAAATVPDGTLHKLLYYLMRDFVDLGPIAPIMKDDAIEDISCDGVGIPVYVYHFEHRDLRMNVEFDESGLDSFVVRLAQRAGEQVSVSDPLVDGSLPDGSRLQLTFGRDVTTRGSNFTIRKFSSEPITPVQLVQWETFTAEQMAYFWLVIEHNRSLIFSGGTGSGKTTSMNAVSMFIPEDSKVVSIEDTREIVLPNDNWVQSLTREGISASGQGEVSMYELFQAGLRQRPEYILVGEIRAQERVAFTFFQAIGTGHTCYTTIHADSLTGLLNRVENPPLDIPTQMVLDLDVVAIQKQTFQDGERVRRNMQVSEILPSEGEENVRAIDVFSRDAADDEIRQVNDSDVLHEIAEDRGWGQRELAETLSERVEILEYLVENDISGYREFTSILEQYERNPELLLTRIREDELHVEDVLEAAQ